MMHVELFCIQEGCEYLRAEGADGRVRVIMHPKTGTVWLQTDGLGRRKLDTTCPWCGATLMVRAEHDPEYPNL
jgi:hypothetical protein